MRNENGMFVSVGCFSGNEQRKSTLSIVSFNSAQSIVRVEDPKYDKPLMTAMRAREFTTEEFLTG
jgi:hypothetical protein